MTDLEKAAQAVLVRWDSPAWQRSPAGRSTAALMADLRRALAAHREQAEPVVDDKPVPDAWHLSGYGMESRVMIGEPSERHRQLFSDIRPMYWHPAKQAEPVDKALTNAEPQVDKEQAEPVSALTRYNEIAEDVETTCNALERLRIFCSLAMTKEDWLDAEPFFDAAEAELTKLDVRLAEIDRLKQQAEPMGGEVERLMSVLEIQDATITALSAAQQAKPIDWVCDWVWDYVEPQQSEPVVEPVSCGHESCDCRGYCKRKQAEPVVEPSYFGLTKDHTWLSIDKAQYDKLKPRGRMACIVRSDK
jgi:hypothetical protein